MKYSPHKNFLRKKKVSYGLRITDRKLERLVVMDKIDGK
jgi:hypothetical protein